MIHQFRKPLLHMALEAVVGIVVHGSWSPAGARNYRAADIHRDHLLKGYDGIGYHYVILPDGSIEVGRPLDAVGAHQPGWNPRTWGICLIGGKHPRFSDPILGWENNYSPDQFASLGSLIWGLQQKKAGLWVKGHRDHPKVEKQCPGFDAGEFYAGWLRAHEAEVDLIERIGRMGQV